MNQKNYYHWMPSRYLPAAMMVLLMLLLINPAGNAEAGELNSSTAQEADQAAKGTVSGTLTINGKPIKLKYAYARKREIRPLDIKWFGLKEGEKLEDGVVELMITNQPLSEDIKTQILEDKYHGSKKIRGILLTLDASEKHGWINTFLLDYGTASKGAGMTMGQGKPHITESKVSGKLLYKHQGAGDETTYVVSFDVPLELRLSEITTAKSEVNTDKFINEFKKIIPGKWSVQSWRGETGESHTGTLSVNEPFDGENFRGTFYLAGDTLSSTLEEDVTITSEGTEIHMEGTEARMEGHAGDHTKWSLDKLIFQLKNKLLVGGGRDENGTMSHVVLRKIR